MPDIRRLVDRIAEILGPDSTPERVESVAAALLEELPRSNEDHSPAFLSSPDPGNHIVITAYGLDQPGILSAITDVVSRAGCNIRDVSQKILQGYFTLIMLADIGGARQSITQLQQELARVGERMGVRIIAQHEDLFNAMHRP